ncbi:LVIVD repeat-containing protein [Halosolutus gelatinilyticus]|uniref:LVIVD repeat-containing protein n=1 Tax=Halosolutus gelatinilyticus TaxID=2931975 RepID=UPI001FF619EE|nr:hypothetical protein [Halosolutus gelatinilyticus]
MHRRALLRTGVTAGAALVSPRIGAASIAAARQDTGEFEPLGRISVEGAAEAAVDDTGDVAYLAATNGFATVDVSDPAEPKRLAEERRIEVDGAQLSMILDVSVDGDRLVAPGPVNPIDRFFDGFVVYDVSDPADPERVADYETGYHIHNCELDGDVLYVVANGPGGNALELFDVGGDEVEELGRWSLLDREPEWEEVGWRTWYLHDVTVRDDVACLAHWDAGTYLLDVSDPSEPEHIFRVAEVAVEDARDVETGADPEHGLPGNDHYAAVDDTGDLLAVGREAWTTGGSGPDGPGGIDLYDVGDPDDPRRLATIDPPEPESGDGSYNRGEWTTSHNFELRDGRLYSSWYQAGVKVHDVSDPGDPVELVSWADRETAGFWTARVATPGETFVASSTGLIPNAETEHALYTFPIPPDENGEDGGTGAADDDDSVPGFAGIAGVVGLAGGALGLEWARRRRGRDRRRE